MTQWRQAGVRVRNGRRVDVDLGEMKGEFVAWCLGKGLTESDGIRLLVGKVVGAAPTSVPRSPLHDGADGARRRVEMKLTGDEYEALDALARRTGFSVNRLVIAMIRAQATGDPALGERELAALSESNYQLAAIGRNLNQIARILNAEPGKAGQRDRLVLLDGLRHEIDTHLKKVHDMLRSNVERWRR